MKQDKQASRRSARKSTNMDISSWFSRVAQRTASLTGHPLTFLFAVLVVVGWIASGPIFGYSDTWQLVINTGTTIVTFLMVFLIQNTQNRDIMTLQLKLSELVLAQKGAEDQFAAIEDLSDRELEKLHDQCRTRAEMTLHHIEQRHGKRKPRAAAQRAKAETRRSPRRNS